MKYKITIEIDSNTFTGIEDRSKEVKEMLMVAQSAVVQKHIDRLVSAGSMQYGSFCPTYTAHTFVELRDEEKKEV